MSTLPAARLHDPVGHDMSMEGAIAGEIAGLAITAFIKVPAIQIIKIGRFPVGGSVLAKMAFRAWSAAVKAARAKVREGPGEIIGAALGSIGEDLGSKVTVASNKIIDGSNDVFINLRKAARILDPVDDGSKIAEGSETVLINERPAARKSDKTDKGSFIVEGSENVLVAGPKTTQAKISARDAGLMGEVGKEVAGNALKDMLQKKNPLPGVKDAVKDGVKGWLFDQVKDGVKSMFGFGGS